MAYCLICGPLLVLYISSRQQGFNIRLRPRRSRAVMPGVASSCGPTTQANNDPSSMAELAGTVAELAKKLEATELKLEALAGSSNQQVANPLNPVAVPVPMTSMNLIESLRILSEGP